MTAPLLASFAPAKKEQLRARLAFDGPTGSGKTWTMLDWATHLAAFERAKGGAGRIAVIDTERKSASLYADHFSFEVMNWPPPYDPRVLTKVIRETVDLGFDVIIVDSLTHFWKGEGGTLEIVDGVAARSQSGNSFTAWSVGTPAIRGLVDTILAADAHVLVSMRSKMEYVLEDNGRGQKVPRKVGLAPEMRGDIEYEFTVVVSMDLDHRGVVGKTRCDLLDGMVIAPGPAATEDAAVLFASWLNSGEAAVDYATPAQLEAFRRWLNSMTGQDRKTLRAEWPLGVPSLDAPGFTVDHVVHLAEAVTRITGQAPTPAIATALAGGDLEDEPDDLDEPGPDPTAPEPPAPDDDAPTGDALPLEDDLDGDPEPPPAADVPPEPAPADEGAAAPDGGAQAPDAAPGDSAASPQPVADPPAPTELVPDEVDPADAAALRLEAVIADVGRLTPRQINDQLAARDAALSGNVHTLSARLVSLLLADEGIDIAQVKVREHLK